MLPFMAAEGIANLLGLNKHVTLHRIQCVPYSIWL